VIQLVLDSHRDKADPSLTRMARPFLRCNPNHLTVISLIFAVITGCLLYLGTAAAILLAALTLLVSAISDALDGKVAKATGRASPRGDLLDHSLDRYADIFIIGGLMFGPLCRWEIGLLGMLGVLMASYMGTQAHALTGKRDYGGLIGRADRLVLLFLVMLIQYAAILFDLDLFGFTVMEGLMIWFAVAGQVTAVYRGGRAWRNLEGPKRRGMRKKP
jgi:archaetidylinositol phosphate synthase